MENIESGTGTRLAELSESVAAVTGPGSVAALRGPNYFDGSREVDHSISIFAGIFTFVFGSLGYPLLPMIVGALQDHLHFTIRQVGAIASGEMSGCSCLQHSPCCGFARSIGDGRRSAAASH
jgi:hypothetical protein